MFGAITGITGRNDLAPVFDKCFQALEIFIIDVLYLFYAKPAKFLAGDHVGIAFL